MKKSEKIIHDEPDDFELDAVEIEDLVRSGSFLMDEVINLSSFDNDVYSIGAYYDPF